MNPDASRNYQSDQRLLTIDAEMARRRAFLDMSANLNPAPLTQDVTIPVVVHILYKAGTSTNDLPKASDIRQQLDITSKDFRQTVKIIKHEADTIVEKRYKQTIDII